MKIRTVKSSCVLACSIAVIGWGSMAEAQDVPPEVTTSLTARSEADANIDAQLGDIVVTAQRRRESLQSVPIAATAVSQEDLMQRGVNDVRDISAVVPNLSVDSPFGNTSPKFVLRGVGSGSFNQNTESTVAIYLDEFVLNPTSSKLGQLFDLERVEVLRGPQGTLYGKNSTGGAINFITRRPNGETAASASATVARYGEYVIELAGETAITDKLSVRGAFKRRYRDGYAFNTLLGESINDNDDYGGRLGFRYRDGDFDAYLKFFADRSRAKGFYQNTLGVELDAAGTPRADNSNPITGYIAPTNIDVGAYNDQRSFVDNRGVTLNLDVGLGAVTLASITGFLNSKADVVQDFDGSPFPLGSLAPFFNEADQITQEVRLASDATGAFSWIVGASFFQQTLVIRDVYDLTFVGLPLLDANIREKSTSFAGFVDGTLKLSSQFSVFAGVRLTTDKKTFTSTSTSSLIGPYAVTTSRRWTEPTYRLGVNFQLNPSTLFYASYNHGYRSGAYDTGLITTTDQFIPANPELVDNYEAGFKTTVFDRRLRIAAALYYTKFIDQQLLIVRPEPGSVCCSLVSAGKSRIYGFEIEGSARFSDNFDVQFSATKSDGKYQIFRSAGLDFSGETLGGLPDYTIRVAPELRVPAFGGNFFLAPEAVFTGEIRRTSALDSFRRDIVRPYAIVNGQAGFRGQDNRYSAFVFVKNATNKRVLTDFLGLSSFGLVQTLYSEPVTWGITTSFQF